MSRSRYRPHHPHYRKNGPSSWRRMTTERPNRAAAKQAEKALARGADPDTVTFPVWNKPQIYWW